MAEQPVSPPCARCGGTPSEHIGWDKRHLYTATAEQPNRAGATDADTTEKEAPDEKS